MVLTPTLTFCGAVAAIRHAGLVPALVDTDEATLTVSPQAVAAAAAWARPAAMIVQHMAGYPAPPLELAEAAGLPPHRVIEDAAHGLGTWVDTVPVGRESHAACFSFYATKNLPIGEGGADRHGRPRPGGSPPVDATARDEQERLDPLPTGRQLALRRRPMAG